MARIELSDGYYAEPENGASYYIYYETKRSRRYDGTLTRSAVQSWHKAASNSAPEWQDIASAPKDGTKILAWCNHESDPWQLGEDDRMPLLTTYAAHVEGLGHAPTGYHIVEWGGAYDDSWDGRQVSIPDWWFVVGTDFEMPANPTHWQPLPAPPHEDTPPVDGASS